MANTLGSRHIRSTSAADGVRAEPRPTSMSMDDTVGQVRFVLDKPVDSRLTYVTKSAKLRGA